MGAVVPAMVIQKAKATTAAPIPLRGGEEIAAPAGEAARSVRFGTGCPFGACGRHEKT
ncbi:hypothetical protein GCM10010425_39990 [Streptomyces spororaveus]|uniref:Uncharacterized protein n=1 Tax=Streptomyces spororaveus TaxID=284039 RepID=A0ABQ3TE53_9ACTN|nr:hypothetical protein Sspor_42340 [Streptomyces spororaveus]